MDLIIKTIPESKFTVSFPKEKDPNSLTVLDVKNEIVKVAATKDIKLITLVFVGKILNNDDLLSKNNIKNNSVLIMIIKKEKDPSSNPAPAPPQQRAANNINARNAGNARNVGAGNAGAGAGAGAGNAGAGAVAVAGAVAGNIGAGNIGIENRPDIRNMMLVGMNRFNEVLNNDRGQLMEMLMANPLISDQINNQEQLNNILNDPNFINSILEIGRGMIVNDQNVNQERANGEDGEENEDGLPVLEQVNPARVNIPAFTEADETNITSLMNLGASRRDAMHYYVSCNYNVDLAANMIFDEQNN